MTLIVGIKCSDGIVVAADGAATLGFLGQQTVKQPVKKLCFIGDEVILAVSGPTGLGQRIEGTIGELYKDKKNLLQKKPYKLMSEIRVALWTKHFEFEMKVAAIAQTTIGPAALSDAVSSTVLALPVRNEPFLIQFNSQGSPEYATDNLPFLAIGSGQNIADPFLAFLRRVFWPNKLPTLSEGVFAAVWSLHHSITVHPGGVADPKQVAVLEKMDGNSWKLRELPPEELQEHEQFARTAEKHVSDFSMESKPRSDEPAPPKPDQGSGQ